MAARRMLSVLRIVADPERWGRHGISDPCRCRELGVNCAPAKLRRNPPEPHGAWAGQWPGRVQRANNINRIAHFTLPAAFDQARQASERHVQSGCSAA